MLHFQGRTDPQMLYPITKVELMEIRDEQVVVARTFVVTDDTPEKWVEAS